MLYINISVRTRAGPEKRALNSLQRPLFGKQLCGIKTALANPSDNMVVSLPPVLGLDDSCAAIHVEEDQISAAMTQCVLFDNRVRRRLLGKSFVEIPAPMRLQEETHQVSLSAMRCLLTRKDQQTLHMDTCLLQHLSKGVGLQW